MLVTEDIAVVGGDQKTLNVFKNYTPFRRCIAHISDEHVETAENLDIIMLMYNLQFEQNLNADGDLDNVTTADSPSFKYKSDLLEDLNFRSTTANANPNIAASHRLFTNAKIVVPTKYLSVFFRSLEMPLIN